MLDLSPLLVALKPIPATVTSAFTRPANATAYSAGKVLADSTSAGTCRAFNIGLGNGGAFRLNRVVWLDNCTNQAGSNNYDFALHLFDTNSFAMNDGANFDLTFANMAHYVGMVPLLMQTAVFSANITGGESTGSAGKRVAFIENLDMQLQCAAGDSSIYGILECLNAWTPVSAEQFQINFIGESIPL